jgi:hypothetical protein
MFLFGRAYIFLCNGGQWLALMAILPDQCGAGNICGIGNNAGPFVVLGMFNGALRIMRLDTHVG